MKNLVLVVFAILVIGACSKNESGGGGGGGSSNPPDTQVSPGTETNKPVPVVKDGFLLETTADLSDASRLVIKRESSSQTDEEPKMQMKKIVGASNAKLFDVLSSAHQIYAWKETETHIIAAVKIKDASGSCSLIAIPKKKEKGNVLCLNRQRLQPYFDAQDADYSFDVKGKKVWFAFNYEPYDPNEGLNELRYWDGESQKVEAIFRGHWKKDFRHPVRHVFVSQQTEAICIRTDWVVSGLEYNTSDILICKSSPTQDWQYIEGRFSQKLVRLSERLIGGYSLNFNLSTLKFEEGKGSQKTPELRYGILKNKMLLAYNGEGIFCMDEAGKVNIYDETKRRPYFTGHRDWVWYAGLNKLSRVNVNDCALDKTNYIEKTNLLDVTNLAWVVGNLLKVEGTGKNGFPQTVYLSPEGEPVSYQGDPTPLEQSIELSWEK